MNKKQRTMMLILVIALVVGLGSITYAYWTANTENKISTNTTIQTGVLKLVLDDGTNKDGVLSGTIDPNNTKFTTYLSITNEGTYDTFARLYFKGLTNTFSSDLVYSIEEVDSLPNNGSTPKIVKRIKYQVPVPSASEPAREILADGLLIKMGTLNGNNLTPNTQYYRVTVEYLYSDTVDQSSDMGKSFYTGFDIEQGDKVTENIVMIDYIEDLVELANEVNAGDNKSGKEYRLMRNLDFNDNDSYRDATQTTYGDINKNGTTEPIKTELTTARGWNSIGHPIAFEGDFDGQNNELRHLYMNNNIDSTKTALFGSIKNSTIKNFGVRDVNLSTTSNLTVSAPAGIAASITNSTIDNCYNTVTIRDDNVINMSKPNGNNSFGGLVCNSYGTSYILNSHNDANMSGGYSLGGILSGAYDNTTIRNCYNTGKLINNYGVQIGGIVGHIGFISGDDNAPAINTIIEDSYNTGNIISDNVNVGVYSGGIVGFTYQNGGNIIIRNSYNIGNILLNNAGGYTGGVFGANSANNLQIERCHNNGEIRNSKGHNSDNRYVGLAGILGATYGNASAIKISNSYNKGKVSGGTYVGGIVGVNSNNLIIYNSYNISDIESSSSYTRSSGYSNRMSLGGIAGLATSGSNMKVINSYNKGNISGYYNVCGIYCTWDGTANNKVINSYNAGSLNSNGGTTYGIALNFNDSTSKTIYTNNVFNIGSSTGGTIYSIVNPYGTRNINNSYYINTISNAGGGTEMALENMKSQTFVDTLNTNKNNINLSSIDSNLSEYSLVSWKLGANGYPVLDYQE